MCGDVRIMKIDNAIIYDLSLTYYKTTFICYLVFTFNFKITLQFMSPLKCIFCINGTFFGKSLNVLSAISSNKTTTLLLFRMELRALYGSDFLESQHGRFIYVLTHYKTIFQNYIFDVPAKIFICCINGTFFGEIPQCPFGNILKY